MTLRREQLPHEYAPVQVRDLRRTDLCACLRIDRMAYRPEDRWSESTWYDAKDVSPCVVACQGVHVVGFAIYDVRPRRIELLKLAVHPRLRRRGIGTLLAGRVADACEGHRRKFIQTTCPLDLAGLPALQFFKSLGWPGYLAEDGDAVSFVRESREILSH